MANWRYVAHDLRTNERLGDLPLGGVTFTERLNGQQTLSATVDLGGRTSPRVVNVADSSWPTEVGDGFIDVPADWVENPPGSGFYDVPGIT